MISSLYELNETINAVATRIIEYGTQHTISGNRYIGHDVVEDLISEKDYLQYFNFIADELRAREEILDLDTSEHEFSCNFALDYCPNYEWTDGDELVFGCSRDEWEVLFHAKPISRPLSISRMAEIGQAGISYVLESSDIVLEDLTERLGMSMAELEQLGIYDFGQVKEISSEPNSINFYVWSESFGDNNPFKFNTFEDAIKSYKALKSHSENALSFLVLDEQGRGHGAVLIQYSDYYKRDRLCSINEEALNNPLIALAYAKASLYFFPNDKVAWARRDAAEEALRIKGIEVNAGEDFYIGKWRVHMVPPGGHYGLNNQVLHDENEPLVEFFDMSQDREKFPEGQFTGGRYYASTLLGTDRWSTGRMENGLNLDPEVSGWSVSGREMKKILQFVEAYTFALHKGKDLDAKIDDARKTQKNHQNHNMGNDIER